MEITLNIHWGWLLIFSILIAANIFSYIYEVWLRYRHAKLSREELNKKPKK